MEGEELDFILKARINPFVQAALEFCDITTFRAFELLSKPETIQRIKSHLVTGYNSMNSDVKAKIFGNLAPFALNLRFSPGFDIDMEILAEEAHKRAE